MERHTIINALIKHYNYKSYLEIGLNNPFDNFTKIICENKESVDPYFDVEDLSFSNRKADRLSKKELDTTLELIPKYLTYRMTSDEFFEKNNKKYDIIFIDGLHTKEQVSKDIVNSLKILNKGGKIVVHDCLPPTEEHQMVPRIPNCGWCGDVWKAIPEFIKQGLDINVVNCDFGCAVISYCEQPERIEIPSDFEHIWPDFNYCGQNLMHIISPEVFLLLLLIDKRDEI